MWVKLIYKPINLSQKSHKPHYYFKPNWQHWLNVQFYRARQCLVKECINGFIAIIGNRNKEIRNWNLNLKLFFRSKPRQRKWSQQWQCPGHSCLQPCEQRSHFANSSLYPRSGCQLWGPISRQGQSPCRLYSKSLWSGCTQIWGIES